MSILASLVLMQAAAVAPGAPLSVRDRPRNVLIVVADDLGVDQIAAYGEGSAVPWMPNVHRLVHEGVRFRNAYGNPFCSPTRAALLTGRHAFRTGMGTYMIKGELGAHALQPAELTLPELVQVSPHGYSTAAIGKWHLGNETVGGPLAPNVAGFQHFAGSDGNLTDPETYSSWTKTVDGHQFTSTTYATADTVDEALAFVAGTPEPWLLYVAFNAVHTPLHTPPPGTYVVEIPRTANPHFDQWYYFTAAAEAMDRELGRLVEGLGEALDRTHLIFLGDNGSPLGMVLPPIPPYQHKGMPYEGGIGVPLIVRSPAVAQPGSEVTGLVQVTDIFATVAELLEIDLAAALPVGSKLDSISLVPYLADPNTPSLRTTAFSEFFTPNGFGPREQEFHTLRDERYKLIREAGQLDRLFDLLHDPYESINLLHGSLAPAQQAAYDALTDELDQILGS